MRRARLGISVLTTIHNIINPISTGWLDRSRYHPCLESRRFRASREAAVNTPKHKPSTATHTSYTHCNHLKISLPLEIPAQSDDEISSPCPQVEGDLGNLCPPPPRDNPVGVFPYIPPTSLGLASIMIFLGNMRICG